MAVAALAVVELLVRTTGTDDLLARLATRGAAPAGVFSGTRAFDPALGWRLAPGAALPDGGGRVNALGLVGREIAVPKAAGRRRILTLGDSVTYGQWACGRDKLCRRRPYPTALELRLWSARADDRVEVVNAGVYGYTTRQGWRAYRQRWRALAPDVVIVAFGWNDHTQRAGGELRDPTWPPLRATLDAAQSLASYRAAIALLTVATGAGRAAAPRIADVWIPRVPRDEFASNLRAIAAAVRADGGRVLFLTQPVGPNAPPYHDRSAAPPWELAGFPTYDAYVAAHADYMDALRAAARAAEVPLVDGAALFAAQDPSALFDPHDMIHPNERGAALLAEALFEQLEALGWVTR